MTFAARVGDSGPRGRSVEPLCHDGSTEVRRLGERIAGSKFIATAVVVVVAIGLVVAGVAALAWPGLVARSLPDCSSAALVGRVLALVRDDGGSST